MKFDFVTVDVFTTTKFGGNPLAVLPDARGLATEQMQAIAAEFNYAETTFVLPAQDAAHTAQVRIFTPRAEMPFAGHPNVGTAFVLASEARGALKEPIVFEEKAGLVRLELIKHGGAIVGARLNPPQPLRRGPTIAPDLVANACSLDTADIETANHAPCFVSCGVGFVFAELKTRAALGKAQPRAEIFAAHVKADAATGILLYVKEATGDADIQARMFAPLVGVAEDPATGSANVALAGFLANLRPERDLTLNLRIAQGVDMGRPSLLEASAEKRDGEVKMMSIGGRCVPMMRGTLEL
jgi:trans-2,3-dihydro-3-hydroxyanthranilate isomerase